MKDSVNVSRKTVVNSSEVRSGNSVFQLNRTASGVSVGYRGKSVVIPDGAVGQALLAELATMVVGTAVTAVAKPKRKRRTKAEIEAAKAGEAEAQ